MRVELRKYNQEGYSRGRNGFICILWWFIQGTVFRFSLHNMNSWRGFLLRLFGGKVGKNVIIRSSAKFTYPWKVSIGDNSWIGDDVYLYSLDNIVIENDCVISQKSYLCTGTHDYKSPTFQLITKPIYVKKGAWIAADTFVYPGVTINAYALAAARSTVINSIPENNIYSGNPAVYLKMRFEEE